MSTSMNRKFPIARAPTDLPNPPLGSNAPSRTIGAGAAAPHVDDRDSFDVPNQPAQFASSAITRSRCGASSKNVDAVAVSLGNTPVTRDVVPSNAYKMGSGLGSSNTTHRASTADKNGVSSKLESGPHEQNGRRVNTRARSETQNGSDLRLPTKVLQQPFGTPHTNPLASSAANAATMLESANSSFGEGDQTLHHRRLHTDTGSRTGSTRESPGRRTTSRALNIHNVADHQLDSLDQSKTLDPQGTQQRRYTERAGVKTPVNGVEPATNYADVKTTEKGEFASSGHKVSAASLRQSSTLESGLDDQPEARPQRTFPPRILVSLHGGYAKAPPMSNSSSKNSENGYGFTNLLSQADSEPKYTEGNDEPQRYTMQNLPTYEKTTLRSADPSEATSTERDGLLGSGQPVDYVPFHSFRTNDGGDGGHSTATSRFTPSYGPVISGGVSADASANTPSVFGTYPMQPPRSNLTTNRTIGIPGNRRTENNSSAAPTTSFIGVPAMRASSHHHGQNEFGISARDRSEEGEVQFGEIVGPNRRASIDMLHMLYQPLPQPQRSTPPLRTWSHLKGVGPHPPTDAKPKEQPRQRASDPVKETFSPKEGTTSNKDETPERESRQNAAAVSGGITRPDSDTGGFLQMQPTMIMQQDEIVIDDGLGLDSGPPGTYQQGNGVATHSASERQTGPVVSLESPTHTDLVDGRSNVASKTAYGDQKNSDDADTGGGAIPSSSPMLGGARMRQFGGPSQRSHGNDRQSARGLGGAGTAASTAGLTDGTAPLDQIYNSIVEFYKVFKGNDAPLRINENAVLDTPEMTTNATKDPPTLGISDYGRMTPGLRAPQDLASREASHERPTSPSKIPSQGANDRLHRRMSTKTSFFVNVDESADMDGPGQADNQTIGKLVNRALESFFNPDADAGVAPSLSMWRRSRDSRVFRSTRSMLTVGGDNNFSRLISFKTYDSSRGFGRDMEEEDDDDECDEPLNMEKMKQIVAGAQAMFTSMSGRAAMSVSKSDTLPMGQFTPEMLRQLKVPDPRSTLGGPPMRAGAPPGSFITLDSAACVANREESDFSREMDGGLGPLSRAPERPPDALTAMRNAAALEMFRNECEKQHNKKVNNVAGGDYTGFGAFTSKTRPEFDSFGDALTDNNNNNNDASSKEGKGRVFGGGKPLDDTLRSMSLDSRSIDNKASSKTDVFETFRTKEPERDVVDHLPAVLEGEDVISVGDTMGTSTPAASLTGFASPKQMSPKDHKSLLADDDYGSPTTRRKTDKPILKVATPVPEGPTIKGLNGERTKSPIRDLPLENLASYSPKTVEKRKVMTSVSPEPQDGPMFPPLSATPGTSAGSPSLLDRAKQRAAAAAAAAAAGGQGGSVRTSAELTRRQGTSSPSTWSESTNRTELSPGRGTYTRIPSNYFPNETGGNVSRSTAGAQFRSATTAKASIKALIDDETLKRCILIELEKQLFIRTKELIRSLYVSAAVRHAHPEINDDERASPVVVSEPNPFGYAFNAQRSTPSPRVARGSIGGAEGILRRGSLSENANTRGKRPPSAVITQNPSIDGGGASPSSSGGAEVNRRLHLPDAHAPADNGPSDDIRNTYGPSNPEYPIFPISSVASPRRLPFTKTQEQQTLSSNKSTVPSSQSETDSTRNSSGGSSSTRGIAASAQKDTKDVNGTHETTTNTLTNPTTTKTNTTATGKTLASTLSSGQLSPLLFNHRTAKLPTLGRSSPRRGSTSEKRTSQSDTHSDSLLTPAPGGNANAKHFRPRPSKPERLSISNRLSLSDSNSTSNGKKQSKRRKNGERQSPKLRSGSKGGKPHITTPKGAENTVQSAFLTFESKDKQMQKAWKSNESASKLDGGHSVGAPAFDLWNYSYASLQTTGGVQESASSVARQPDAKMMTDKQGKGVPLQDLMRSKRFDQSGTFLGTTFGGTSKDYFGFDDDNEDEKPSATAVRGGGGSDAGKLNSSMKANKTARIASEFSAEMTIDTKNEYDEKEESQFEYDLRGVNSIMPSLDVARRGPTRVPKDTLRSVSPSSRQRSDAMVYTPLATATGVFGKSSTDTSPQRTITPPRPSSDQGSDEDTEGRDSDILSDESPPDQRLTRAGTRRPRDRSPRTQYTLPNITPGSDKVSPRSRQRTRVSTADEEVDEDAFLSTEQLSAVVEQLYPLVSNDSTLDGLPRGRQHH